MAEQHTSDGGLAAVWIGGGFRRLADAQKPPILEHEVAARKASDPKEQQLHKAQARRRSRLEQSALAKGIFLDPSIKAGLTATEQAEYTHLSQRLYAVRPDGMIRLNPAHHLSETELQRIHMLEKKSGFSPMSMNSFQPVLKK